MKHVIKPYGKGVYKIWTPYLGTWGMFHSIAEAMDYLHNRIKEHKKLQAI